MEKTGCELMCGAQTTIAVKGLMMMMMIFRGHSTREPAPSRVTYFILRPTQEPALATANTGKNQERFWKNAGKWSRRVEISKEESLAASVACMAVY